MAAAIDIITQETATHEQRVAAAQLTISTLTDLGCEELVPYLQIEWSRDFTARMGDALYMGSLRDRNEALFAQVARRHRLVGDGNYLVRVRYSSILWPRASEEERQQTVIHEVCHIVNKHEAIRDHRGIPSAHGPEWRAVMRRAGVSPKRCHNVDNSDLKRRSRKTVPATCRCGEHPITERTAIRILGATHTYSCRKCKATLKVSQEAFDSMSKGAQNAITAYRISRRSMVCR
jgi:predicted SprT family Zn-dependent metalloprotease